VLRVVRPEAGECRKSSDLRQEKDSVLLLNVKRSSITGRITIALYYLPGKVEKFWNNLHRSIANAPASRGGAGGLQTRSRRRTRRVLRLWAGVRERITGVKFSQGDILLWQTTQPDILRYTRKKVWNNKQWNPLTRSRTRKRR
jgi:hypothetical protein